MTPRNDTRPIWLLRLLITTFCLGVYLSPTFADEQADPLPKFTFQKVALHPKDLTYAPTGDLIHPTIIKTEGRIKILSESTTCTTRP